ncbi:ExbD/TolR family protein [Calditerrivibrio nitroreducens]|uniref:Biopolymer transport protein ExbD/TolR n=1 Tax=Calditerrivibrio nitroreducens (strain DSM 19672 / NBRC 101217 / Yu37-1) TaxID=768670 RepID=E4TFZ9_CALNY|nr:biopolymer transporter ExbD [Calditerrivibrio nitroreducens]ADR18549.1 Biopolymer transport protein ExbD/TolR [Calditerrivibrio nitroreducens DSM 19672]
MKFRKDRIKNNGIEVPTTSITDIIFLIVLFLMVSATFTTYNINNLNISLPKAKGENVTETKTIVIAITKNREFSIENQRIDPNLIPSKLKEYHDKFPEASIMIQADKEALHGDVVYVMDESKKVGFNKLAIAAETEE